MDDLPIPPVVLFVVGRRLLFRHPSADVSTAWSLVQGSASTGSPALSPTGTTTSQTPGIAPTIILTDLPPGSPTPSNGEKERLRGQSMVVQSRPSFGAAAVLAATPTTSAAQGSRALPSTTLSPSSSGPPATVASPSSSVVAAAPTTSSSSPGATMITAAGIEVEALLLVLSASLTGPAVVRLSASLFLVHPIRLAGGVGHEAVVAVALPVGDPRASQCRRATAALVALLQREECRARFVSEQAALLESYHTRTFRVGPQLWVDVRECGESSLVDSLVAFADNLAAMHSQRGEVCASCGVRHDVGSGSTVDVVVNNLLSLPSRVFGAPPSYQPGTATAHGGGAPPNAGYQLVDDFAQVVAKVVDRNEYEATVGAAVAAETPLADVADVLEGMPRPPGGVYRVCEALRAIASLFAKRRAAIAAAAHAAAIHGQEAAQRTALNGGIAPSRAPMGLRVHQQQQRHQQQQQQQQQQSADSPAVAAAATAAVSTTSLALPELSAELRAAAAEVFALLRHRGLLTLLQECVVFTHGAMYHGPSSNATSLSVTTTSVLGLEQVDERAALTINSEDGPRQEGCSPLHDSLRIISGRDRRDGAGGTGASGGLFPSFAVGGLDEQFSNTRGHHPAPGSGKSFGARAGLGGDHQQPCSFGPGCPVCTAVATAAAASPSTTLQPITSPQAGDCLLSNSLSSLPVLHSDPATGVIGVSAAAAAAGYGRQGTYHSPSFALTGTGGGDGGETPRSLGIDGSAFPAALFSDALGNVAEDPHGNNTGSYAGLGGVFRHAAPAGLAVDGRGGYVGIYNGDEIGFFPFEAHHSSGGVTTTTAGSGTGGLDLGVLAHDANTSSLLPALVRAQTSSPPFGNSFSNHPGNAAGPATTTPLIDSPRKAVPRFENAANAAVDGGAVFQLPQQHVRRANTSNNAPSGPDVVRLHLPPGEAQKRKAVARWMDSQASFLADRVAQQCGEGVAHAVARVHARAVAATTNPPTATSRQRSASLELPAAVVVDAATRLLIYSLWGLTPQPVTALTVQLQQSLRSFAWFLRREKHNQSGAGVVSDSRVEGLRDLYHHLRLSNVVSTLNAGYRLPRGLCAASALHNIVNSFSDVLIVVHLPPHI